VGVAADDADEPPVACWDERRAQPLSLEPLEQLSERDVGPDRAWTVAHRLLDSLLLVGSERAAAGPAEDNPPRVDDEALLPALGA
jgi:hypothetical protein